MTASLADPRQTRCRAWTPRVATVAALVAIGVGNVGLHVYWDHQRSLYERFTRAYGGCLTGTAWDVRTAPAQIPLAGPPRLRIYGQGGQGGQGVRVFAADLSVGSDRLHPAGAATAQVLDDQGVLVFGARTRVGSDRLHPADATTAQVLRDHQCPAG